MGKFQKSQKKPSKQMKGGQKKKFLSKNKRQKNRNNDQDQETHNQHQDNNSIQNAYGIIDKQKLLAMSTQKQLETVKDLISKIQTKPQQNIKHLEALFLLTKVQNLKIVAHVLRALADVFVNIAPLQAVNVKGLEERTQTKVTKDQFMVIRFEKVLVEQYERYIKILKQLKSKLKVTDFASDHELFTEFKKCILQCALTCFKTLWNFNFSKELCDLLLQFIKFKQCQKLFQDFLEDQNIATVTIKVKIINGIAQLIKRKQDRQLPDSLVKILNSTKIDSRYLERDRDALDFKKKKLKQKLYRQDAYEKKLEKEKGKDQNDKLAQKRKKREEKMKIRMKIKDEVQKQFAEGEAIISNKEIVRNNSLILQELFYVYFKILVEKLNSKFLKDTLDGILTFAHWINIDLISSMIEHLDRAAKIFREIWKQSQTNQNLEKRLTIVFTMQSIINGPLSVYNMDDISVTSNFYKILRDINHVNSQSKKINQEVFRLIAITLEECFVKRRQLSQQIVGSFLREIVIFMQRSQIPKLYLLELVRLSASKYSKVSRMFQQDNEGYGINAYNEICQDPQSTNAINTELLTKLNTLRKSSTKYSKQYDGQISEYVTRFFRQNFNRIQHTETLENMLKDDLVVAF